MPMEWDYVSEFRPPTGLLFVRFQVLTAVSMKIRAFWDIASCSLVVVDRHNIWVWKATVEWYWQGEQKKSEKIYPSATLSTTNPTWTDPGRTRASEMRGQRLTAWAMARFTWNALYFQKETSVFLVADADIVALVWGRSTICETLRQHYSRIVLHRQNCNTAIFQSTRKAPSPLGNITAALHSRVKKYWQACTINEDTRGNPVAREQAIFVQ
jgi:hypothetical protein